MPKNSKTIRLYDYKSLSSFQEVIHREAEALPKERNELIDSSSYRPNDFPRIDSRLESGMTYNNSEPSALPKNEMNLFTDSPIHLLTSKKAAFTLAEVLITLAIIGVVTSLTIPSLIENHNEKAWSTAKDLWQKKLVEATRQMNIDGVMTGVAQNTEDYMDLFKKYVKIIKTCENSKLKNCYAPKIVQTAGEEVEVNGLKSAKNLGHDDWDTNTMGFVIADGTTVIMAYNPNCDSVDPFSKEGQNGQVGCMSMMIDVNGKKGPNKVGKDILLSNASISSCDIEFGDLCLAGSDILPAAINTCEDSKYHKYDTRPDSQNTHCSNSYWGGAQKLCEDLGMRLTTPQELAKIATYVYKQDDNPIDVTEYRYSIVPDAKRADELNWSTNGGWYWSSEPYSDEHAYGRSFSISASKYGTLSVGNSSYSVMCVKEQ